MDNKIKKYAIFFGILFLSLVAAESVAEEIEEVVVVGSNVKVGSSQPEYDGSLLEAVQPFRVFQPGGLGGVVGATLHGTDVKHTAVYRNGIPVNDPGGGWFDFGTELPMFQDIRIITGPNSVLFGSSAMGGTILLEDSFYREVFHKASEDKNLFIAGNEYVQLAHYNGTNGSARSDNDENDWYENTTLKTRFDYGDWKVVSSYQDYEYDYDNCWFGLDGNECVQEGQKVDTSIRNDWLTVGYSLNDVEHNTGWEAKSERYFIDANEEVIPGLVVGVQGHRQEYNDYWYQHYASYLNWSTDEISMGVRYEDDDLVLRLGYEIDEFRVAIANSVRLPNLYERYGDDWVSANPDLKSEEGKGIELGYGMISSWYYDFNESIDFDMQNYQYINSGGYESYGFKFQNHFLFDNGALHLSAMAQETDKIRQPKYNFRASWFSTVRGWDYLLAYTGQFDRGRDFDGTPIDDVSTFDFNIGKYIQPKFRIGFQISDILDREFEVLPNYGAGGRTFSFIWHLSY